MTRSGKRDLKNALTSRHAQKWPLILVEAITTRNAKIAKRQFSRIYRQKCHKINISKNKSSNFSINYLILVKKMCFSFIFHIR